MLVAVIQPFNVYANTIATAKQISVGSDTHSYYYIEDYEHDIYKNETVFWYCFTPRVEGGYEVLLTFNGTFDDDTLDSLVDYSDVIIYDDNNEYVEGANYSPSKQGFYMQFNYFEVGKSYYIKVDVDADENPVDATLSINYHKHNLSGKDFINGASLSEEGVYYLDCSSCDYSKRYVIPRIKSITLSQTVFKYDGKNHFPKVIAKDVNGKVLSEGSDYIVEHATYSKDPDEYHVSVEFIGNYSGYEQLTYRILKKTQSFSVIAKKVNVKYSKVKKKAQVISAKKVLSVSNAIGKLTYKKVKGNKKITVAKNGKITVKKGLKKGTYKIKINVTAAGNYLYKTSSKTTVVTIKVK